MESEKKNKISVKDIADKLKLREFCSDSSDWQIESSGKRTQIAQDLLDRLESDKEVTYVHIKNSGKKGDKSYYLCPDDVIELYAVPSVGVSVEFRHLANVFENARHIWIV